MCRATTCRRCGNTTWAGCGRHVDQVMTAVPHDRRCTCPPAAPARPSTLRDRLARLLSRS